ncbi:MAG: polyprenyl synthetase family protein, partial [Pseudomonadota bacterium]|nr:polyprenyl synthetase family protein [Pseudomonadota bacterium]
VMLGGLAGHWDHEQELMLDIFGKQVGLLFQVVDDVLDATASTQMLGKTAGKDAYHHKPTYATILTLDAARRLAMDLHLSAIGSVSPFGQKGRYLAALADFILQRQF